MNQILLVEDSPLFGRMTKARLEEAFDVPVYWCKNYAEADSLLIRAKGMFDMALLDFNLPDAPHGEVIDRVVREGISSLVFTSNLSDEVRRQVWSKKVVDYILKDDPSSLNYVVAAMKQLAVNSNSLILVVDDSDMQRNAILELLYIKKYRAISAKNGASALEILDQYPETKVVITDYNMPGMDGCQLCRKIREKHKHEDLAIIGLSSEEDRTLGARFVKSGANDFIVKQTFLVEEFYCRLEHNLHILELIEDKRNAAIRDFLTGMYNRRHFFEEGATFCARVLETGGNVLCAMLDIDLFKKVNDEFGHETGDKVLQYVASQITASDKDWDLSARIGGEEFCLLAFNCGSEEFTVRLDSLRASIAAGAVADQEGNAIRTTVSIGWSSSSTPALSSLMQVADENLYKAKEAGRNRVVG